MALRSKTPPPVDLVRGRSKSFSQDEELAAQRRREQSITFDNVAGLEELTEENLSAIRDLFNRHLHCTLAKDVAVATERDYYLSLSYTVRDHVMVRAGAGAGPLAAAAAAERAERWKRKREATGRKSLPTAARAPARLPSLAPRPFSPPPRPAQPPRTAGRRRAGGSRAEEETGGGRGAGLRCLSRSRLATVPWPGRRTAFGRR